MAAEIFRKNMDTSNLANVITALGQYYFYKSDYENSLKAYFTALSIYRKLNDPKSYENVILALDGISFIYFERKDYKNTLFYMHRALNIAEAIDDNGYTAARLYTGIGDVYCDWKQYDKSLEYYRKAFEINKRTGNTNMLAYSLNSIGRIYFIKNSYDTAYSYYIKASDLFTEINDATGISASNQSLGDIYRVKNKFEIALKYYKMSLSSCEKKDEQARVSSLLYEIGGVYFKMKKFEKAVEFSTKSLDIALSINYMEYVYENYLLLSDIYNEMGNCSKAFNYYKKYVHKKDSIFTTDIHQQIADIQEKYEADKREKKIKILKQNEEIQNISIHKQHIVRNSLLIVVSLLILLALLIFRNLRHKRKANLIIAREKEKSDQLLMNILPEETAEELKREGFAKTRYYDLVTVLFTDFKGFTKIAEKMSPEQLVAELDFCFKGFDLIIEKYNVEKIKTIGDSYMCAGGLPIPNTSNPVDVVNCGIEICNFMKKYKLQRTNVNEPYFEVRVGIHTGPVVSGIVGTKKFAYDIWGDTVNTASRMESSGVAGAVNISGTTYAMVCKHFHCSYRGKIDAKNKGLVDMYLVEDDLAH
jgi:class 3 adenylate cyclase